MSSVTYMPSAGAGFTSTRSQSASISSANIMGNAVKIPCPISACGTRIVLLLSALTLTQEVSQTRSAVAGAR